MAKKHRHPSAPGIETLLNRAIQSHRAGRPDQAIPQYREVLRTQPEHLGATHLLGVALCERGALAEGDRFLTRAAEIAPSEPSVLFDLGRLRQHQGLLSDAIALYERTIAIDPTHSEALFGRALLLAELGRLAEAAKSAAFALQAKPTQDAAFLLARIQERMGRPDFAIETLSGLLLQNPRNVDALREIARLLIQTGGYEDAVAVLQTLLAHRPNDALAHRDLGITLGDLHRFPEAVAALERSVGLDPKDLVAWRMLAHMQKVLQDFDGVARTAERATFASPGALEPALFHAYTLWDIGRVAEAQRALTRLFPAPEARLTEAMLMPPVYQSGREIEERRDHLGETLEDLLGDGSRIEAPELKVPLTNMNLSYHGEPNRALMEKTTEARLKLCPSLGYVSNRLERPPLAGRKIRLGHLSTFFRSHAVGRVLNRFLQEIDRDRFEVILLEMPTKGDGSPEEGRRYADRSVVLPNDLSGIRRAVEDENLDVLWLGDPISDPLTDYLAHSRLAPVQFTTWSHPGTTGRETIDYWVSCDDWEPEGNERFYTERLVRLSQPPMIATRLPDPERVWSRAELGLPEGRLYGCVQGIYKLHPDFDALMAEVLRRDPEAKIVLSSALYDTWRKVFHDRFAEAHGDVADRLVYVPHLSASKYLSVLSHCEVSLDPIHFAGGNTSMDALSQGLPVICLPGTEMRSRMTLSFYRMMGLTDLVVDTPEAYVDLAVRLGTDRELRDRYSREVRERASVLFDTVGIAREFEAFIEQAAREAIPG